MKNTATASMLGILIASTSLAFAAGPSDILERGRPNAPRNATVTTGLAADDAATLTWMREEEKVARDVYAALFNTWQAREFANIATAEQRHFDALGSKVRQFGLADPAMPDVGQFSNADMQGLHNGLISTGMQSYADALRVGATIEDMDIRDLDQAIESCENRTLLTTYTNLREGSKNHLRAFVSRLEALGQSYEPQYIDAAEYDAIMGR